MTQYYLDALSPQNPGVVSNATTDKPELGNNCLPDLKLHTGVSTVRTTHGLGMDSSLRV